MTRFAAVSVAVGVVLAGTGVSRADTGMLPGGGTISWEKFYLQQGAKLVEPPDPDTRRRFLNLAHCVCSQAKSGDEQDVAYDLKLSATTNMAPTGDVWVGTMCDDNTNRTTNCRKLTDKTIGNIDLLVSAPQQLRLNLYDVIAGKDGTAPCYPEGSEGTKFVWLLVDANKDGTYDYTTSKSVGEGDGVTKVDTKPPPLPPNLKATGSEESVVISWDAPADSTDLFYFQAFCANADGSPVEGVTAPEAKYQRVSDVPNCTASSAITLGQTTGPSDGAPFDGATFMDLDPAYLCGQSEMGSRSLTIDHLSNNTPYQIAMVAIDNYGNFTGTYFTTTVTPKPVTDFWEDLQKRDSAVDGGCLLSTTYGDGNPLTRTLRSFRDDTLSRSALGRWLTRAYYASLGKLRLEWLPARVAAGIALLPLVAIALLWHLLGLPALLALLALLVWRRRVARALRRGRARRIRLAGAAAVTVLLVAPRLAAADDTTPYWEDPSQYDQRAGDPRWHVGIRVGPYTPDIDLQYPQNAVTGLGPYAAMFGTYYSDEDGDGVGEKHSRHVYQIMPMLDVDRIVWSRFGQIGVGGSLGYMQKTAYVYANGTNQDDPMRVRSSSSENTFRLIPLAATVTYRLTYADDRWGIPIIPYVRGGLSYYMWWIKGPKGEISKACDDPMKSDTCSDEDKAYGGTPGVQVSAGLAIRAERVDPDAARSMRNSGILHAGFYGEVFWGRVDGFGSSSRLWVGDTTWFAGANFEF